MKLIPFLILVLGFPIFSDEWQKGTAFPIIELQDQFESLQPIPKNTEKVFFLSDMEAKKILHKIMEVKKPEYLSSKKAIVISDVHRMPGFITRFAALPRMRGYNYRIHLIRDEKTGAHFPREKNAITYLKLKDYKITEILYLKTPEELEKALEE